jgi:membrane associated rhomboid family serine protease
MFPLRDENPTKLTPFVTIGIIAICSVLYLLQLAGGEEMIKTQVFDYGLIPGKVTQGEGIGINMLISGHFYSFFSSMFIHGGFFHVLGNMLFLWIFGNNIEDSLGHKRFILFFIACGFAAGLAQVATDTNSSIPMVGASGAVSGIMAAYLLLFPHAKIVTLLFLGIFITFIRISAGWYIGGWFVMQAIQGLASSPDGGGVAWWAHIGGFIAGLILLPLMKKPRQTLFQPKRRGPWDP